jgi:hypothetical protein
MFGPYIYYKELMRVTMPILLVIIYLTNQGYYRYVGDRQNVRYPWDGGESRLWSLADMISYPINQLCAIVTQIEILIQTSCGEENPRAELHPSYQQTISKLKMFSDLQAMQDVFGDDDLRLRIWRLQTELASSALLTSEILCRDMEGIRSQILIALSKRKFAYIPPPVDGFFEQDMLFGALVYHKFQSARADIRDAANCIAAGLDTASVFHLMRVAEIGFRYACRKAGITFRQRGKAHPKPIDVEFAGWEDLSQELQKKSNEWKSKLPKGEKRERRIQFYADLSDQCLYLRDIWRDQTMHARRRYTMPESIAVFHRIKHFMNLLAEEIK